MNSFCCDYAVIGGDLRQVYLTEEFARKNKNICHYALCQPPAMQTPSDCLKAFPTLDASINNSASIICPIPFSRDGIYLNQNGTKKNIPLKQILMSLKPNQRLYAGNIPKDFRHSALEMGVLVFDFMKDTELSYFNSIATAEGVLCEAVKASPMNLHQSRCAVLGYGKCGRTIADKLKGLSCYLTVASSPIEERAQAALISDEALPLDVFLSHIDAYDFIFNTIPAMILTKEVLSGANPSVTILDIASSPGGVDFAAAKELSIKALSCPGLPGRYAPLSSARAIQESIINFERS